MMYPFVIKLFKNSKLKAIKFNEVHYLSQAAKKEKNFSLAFMWFLFKFNSVFLKKKYCLINGGLST